MSKVKSWYSGKRILLTGATGFVGKVILEKIIRELDEIDCIYLIIRGSSVELFAKRCQYVMDHLLFGRVREIDPKRMNNKIKFMQGDMTKPGLGLSMPDRTEIIQNVNVVIHNAANVNFAMSLKTAISTNVLGTITLLNLSKEMLNLNVFVYMSTAYSQCVNGRMEERHYPEPMNIDTVVKIAEKFDMDTLNILLPKLLGDFPNTYSFSKSLSEAYVSRYKRDFKIVIIRPSVVIGTLYEPYVGYIEDFNGFGGVTAATSKGVLRITPGISWDTKLYDMPVDILANTVIISAFIRSEIMPSTNDVLYLNATTSTDRAEPIRTHFNNMLSFLHILPPDYSLWYPTYTVTSCKYYYGLCLIFFQLLPSILLDGLILLFGHQPVLMRVQRKIAHLLTLTLPYISDIYQFNTTKFDDLPNKLNDIDNKLFFVDLKNTKSHDRAMRACIGGKVFKLRERIKDLPRSRRIIYCMKALHYGTKTYLLYKLMHWIGSILCHHIHLSTYI